MTVREEPLRRAAPWSKVASAIAWLCGVFTTYLFIATSAVDVPWHVSLLAAFVIQWVLTIAEKPLWRVMLRRKGGKFVLLGIIMTCIDGVFNAAGIFPYVGRLAQTNVGAMLSEVLGVSQTMGTRSAFMLAFAIGLVIAALPEYLWEVDS
jgi:hypothetical protein